MKKRIGAVLMGVLLGTSLIGTNVFATETEPPAESETVFEIVEGATGTYVKGSKKDHVIKVRMSTTAEKIHKVTVDNPENELDRDNWSDGDSEEVPPTTDAPVTSEAPAVTSEAPAPSSEAPAPSSEAPAPSSRGTGAIIGGTSTIIRGTGAIIGGTSTIIRGTSATARHNGTSTKS